jgi:hypothetical protein
MLYNTLFFHDHPSCGTNCSTVRLFPSYAQNPQPWLLYSCLSLSLASLLLPLLSSSRPVSLRLLISCNVPSKHLYSFTLSFARAHSYAPSSSQNRRQKPSNMPDSPSPPRTPPQPPRQPPSAPPAPRIPRLRDPVVLRGPALPPQAIQPGIGGAPPPQAEGGGGHANPTTHKCRKKREFARMTRSAKNTSAAHSSVPCTPSIKPTSATSKIAKSTSVVPTSVKTKSTSKRLRRS